MKLNEIKVGQKVEDSWYPEIGEGIVQKVLKTRVKIYFQRLEPYMSSHNALRCLAFGIEDGIVTYDKAHCQFLQLIK